MALAQASINSQLTVQKMSFDQQQQQDEKEKRGRRRCPPMPSDDIIRNSIASSLTQIMVNMQHAESQQKCRDLLQVQDLSHGAHIRILAHLEYIDAQREQRERAASERKQRSSRGAQRQKENTNTK